MKLLERSVVYYCIQSRVYTVILSGWITGSRDAAQVYLDRHCFWRQLMEWPSLLPGALPQSYCCCRMSAAHCASSLGSRLLGFALCCHRRQNHHHRLR